MDSIVIGFSKPKTWHPFSWLIMTAYNIPYDHVYVRIQSDSMQRNLLYQASSLAVNFMGEDIFNAANDVVREFTVQISAENKLKLLQFAIDNSGKPYGIKDCFGLAYVRICELFGKTVKNPFNDGGATYVCSELAGYILVEFAGATLPEDIGDLTPKDVYQYLLSTDDSTAQQ